eukprot:TRINITY_DN7675_c0_g1_i5.p1 TRINITY_DN7675_c0_g1~~TRINITY_DN7675_c0_g1_i5.p1  ORF type:complete len:240 (-),score=62.15 TRINITY_DN7675_c0_g1_i5:1512-2231(-)
MKSAHHSTLTVYEKALLKHNSFYQPSRKSPDRCQHTSPSRSKYNLCLVEDTAKFSYTDREVSCFLSCIVQLKDHVNYINVLMESILEALRVVKAELKEAKLEVIENLLEEAVCRNIDVITGFSVITGNEKPGNFYDKYKAKLKKSFKNGDSIDFDYMERPISTERKIPRQDNIYLRDIVKKYKEKKDEYRAKAEAYEVEIKSVNDTKKEFEEKIAEIKDEKERVANELETLIKELYNYY